MSRGRGGGGDVQSGSLGSVGAPLQVIILKKELYESFTWDATCDEHVLVVISSPGCHRCVAIKIFLVSPSNDFQKV